MIIRNQFKNGDLSLLVENIKLFIHEQKYLRLKSLLASGRFNLQTKITDLIKLVVIKWDSGQEWATEIDENDQKLLKSITDSNFSKI